MYRYIYLIYIYIYIYIRYTIYIYIYIYCSLHRLYSLTCILSVMILTLAYCTDTGIVY